MGVFKHSDNNSNIELNNTLLEAINLSKRYEDDNLALDNVSFSVHPGQIYSMLGGNGAGKTTAINIILDFIQPTSGETKVCNIITQKEPLKAKQNIAYVSENVMLYTNFTAIQNLDFFAHLAGKSMFNESDYKNVLLRVGLQEEAHHKKLRDFSKGMRQKCGIAIAIIKDAPVIILDEPTSGLDPKAGFEFMHLLKSLRDEGKAIFMSTHDIFRAKDVSDVVGILDNGKLVMQKSKDELKGENLEKLYVEHMAGYYNNNL
jgi:ABC-2 type transport system ATP-binding protein